MRNRLLPARFRLPWIAALAVFASLASLGSVAVLGGTYKSAVSVITRQELRRHCEFLASDALEGRETGTQGGQAAGAYIVAQLRKLKIRPAGIDGDYYQPFQNSRNILCCLDGSHPRLAKEYVIVCAHYDHVGRGSPRNSHGPIGYIHRGADDNASGTATLLALVDAFHSLDVAPKRSTLFLFSDGEEQGLLGSEYWCQYPTIPLERIKLLFNIDMVGRLRDNRAEVYGARTAAGLREFLASNNTDPGILLTYTWETRRDSDHYPFYARQIPFLMVFTGKHPEYHTPYDTADKLNLDGMERVARLLFRAVYAAAEAPRLPGFRQAAYQEGSALQESRELATEVPAPRLGVTWDEESAKQRVIEITQADPGSAAEIAGIRPGDRIVKFDGAAVHSAAEMREAVTEAPEETTAVVVHRGESSARSVPVHLLGPPHPIGIFCRTDDAEPGTLIVSRVLPGSVADRAGLKLNDRILRVAGHPIRSEQELSALVARQTGVRSLEVERDGELRNFSVTLPQREDGLTSPSSPR